MSNAKDDNPSRSFGKNLKKLKKKRDSFLAIAVKTVNRKSREREIFWITQLFYITNKQYNQKKKREREKQR